MQSKLQLLPAIDKLLKTDRVKDWYANYDHTFIKGTLQTSIQYYRQALLAGEDIAVSVEAIIDYAESQLKQIGGDGLTPTINATGTILHTNLGRALLAPEASEAVQSVMSDYSNLEYDIQAGQRGSRYDHMRELLIQLTGAEDALIVNNNAAAVLLILTAFAKGKEVLISRGELVEIGGSFRIPDVISSIGAKLHEVGATNKTHLVDYERGINEETAAILRVHTSNYRIVGFSKMVDDRELVELAHKNGLPIFNDLGSGLLLNLEQVGLSYEPTIKEMIQFGYDLVSFSGDKLLGGPQAGIIVGRKDFIEQLKQAPLLRALRVDKMTIAALEATLRLYLKPELAMATIPTLKMLSRSQEDLLTMAEELRRRLAHLPAVQAEVTQGFSQVGGGAYPTDQLATYLVKVTHENYSASELEEALRRSDSHIIPRVGEEKVQFDVRTLTYDNVQRIVGEFSKL